MTDTLGHCALQLPTSNNRELPFGRFWDNGRIAVRQLKPALSEASLLSYQQPCHLDPKGIRGTAVKFAMASHHTAAGALPKRECNLPMTFWASWQLQ